MYFKLRLAHIDSVDQLISLSDRKMSYWKTSGDTVVL